MNSIKNRILLKVPPIQIDFSEYKPYLYKDTFKIVAYKNNSESNNIIKKMSFDNDKLLKIIRKTKNNTSTINIEHKNYENKKIDFRKYKIQKNLPLKKRISKIFWLQKFNNYLLKLCASI